MNPDVSGQDRAVRRHWRRTLWLTASLLLVWLSITVISSFAPEYLNRWQFLGFPLGFYLAAQGSLLSFLAIVGVHTAAMNRVDRRYRGERERKSDPAASGL